MTASSSRPTTSLYTINTHLNTDGLYWSAPVQINVESVEAPDPYTVVFKLKKPNSRFHALFTVRWNAMWMMPKHIFEQAGDPQQFDFNPPVSLGPYTLHSYDPNGKWFIWAKRDDWERTTVARFGEPGPKYAAYIDPGPPDKRVIAQLNHELDIIHDTSPEGMFTLAKESPTSHGWFDGFPYAHPDPTLPALIFNTQNPLFQNPDVRWALALLIDIKAVSMASYRGAATISAIGVPPTGTHPDYYHKPLQDWLIDFEIDTGKRKIKPYDPTVGQQIADMLRPSMGDAIPTDPEEIGRAFGLGWWKPDPEAAAELLEKAGFTKQGDAWYTPDGEPFKISHHGRGRVAPGHDARRIDDRPAVAPVRHRRLDRGCRGHAGAAPQQLATSTPSCPGASRPGAVTRTCRSSSTAGTRSSSPSPASRSRRATGNAGRTRSSTRSSRRSARSTSTIRVASSWASSTPSWWRERCRPSR